MFSKTRVLMLRHNIFYMHDDYVKKIGDESKSSSDKFIDYLTEKEKEFIDLCHQGVPPCN